LSDTARSQSASRRLGVKIPYRPHEECTHCMYARTRTWQHPFVILAGENCMPTAWENYGNDSTGNTMLWCRNFVESGGSLGSLPVGHEHELRGWMENSGSLLQRPPYPQLSLTIFALPLRKSWKLVPLAGRIAGFVASSPRLAFPLHTDGSCMWLTCQMGYVPEKAYIRVGPEARRWKTVRCLVYDDL
jgi:hypothetical protein